MRPAILTAIDVHPDADDPAGRARHVPACGVSRTGSDERADSDEDGRSEGREQPFDSRHVFVHLPVVDVIMERDYSMNNSSLSCKTCLRLE